MKIKAWKILFVLGAMLSIATIIDCGGGSSPPPTTGFNAQGQNYFLAFDGSFQFLGYTSVQGDWLFDNGSAQGNLKHFAFFSQGYSHVDDGRVPARWRIFPLGACIAFLDPIERNVTVGSNQLARCLVVAAFLAADPSSVDLQNPPGTVTMSGGGFSASYGMPVIQYYDQYSGVLVATTSAFAVSSDGSSLQASTPDLSSVCTGPYNVAVSNVAADGTTSLVGVASIDAWNRDCGGGGYDPPPDPPPCGGHNVCIE